MSDTKHTPAGWEVSWGTFQGGEGHGIYASGEMDLKGHQIAVVNFYPTLDSSSNEDTGKANAKLIAAAPELLEALKNLIENGNIRFSSLLVRRAEAAIKKATL